MAFDLTLLNPIGGQSLAKKAPQLYTYSAGADDPTGAGYFNAAYLLLENRDVILVGVDTPASTFYIVTVNKATGVVTVLPTGLPIPEA